MATIELDRMDVKGNYSIASLVESLKGPFSVVLKDIVAKGNATVGVERDGKIRTQHISMDLKFGHLKTDFQNMGKIEITWPSTQ